MSAALVEVLAVERLEVLPVVRDDEALLAHRVVELLVVVTVEVAGVCSDAMGRVPALAGPPGPVGRG
jgi:hypothetical protein